MRAPAASAPGFRAKLALARAAGALSRRSGRGGGTTVPGRLLLRLAPDAELDDGLLDVGTCGNISKLRFMRGIAKIFKGEHREVLEVEEFRTAEITVEADRPFVVYADGDPIAELPATITLLPRALRVLAPA